MLRILLFLYCFFSSSYFAFAYQCADVFSEKPQFLIEDSLLQAEVESVQPLRGYLESIGKTPDGSSEPSLVKFKSGVKSIFKHSEDKDRSLWSAYGERAAYKFSHLLEFDFVSFTTIRDINGKTGSLQHYIENKFDPQAMRLEKKQKLFNALPEKVKSDFHLFHYLIGQWDRHWGNVIIQDNKIYSIDNELISDHSVSRFGKYSFVRRGVSDDAQLYTYSELRNFPFDRVQHEEDLSLNNLMQIFNAYMSTKKIEKYFQKFKRKKLRNIRYIKWKGQLWLQSPMKSMGPAFTTKFSQQTLDKLRAITPRQVEKIYEDFSSDNQHAVEFLLRRDQILEASEQGIIIP